MVEPRKPVHGRDPLGRHKVDLRNIRSPWLRYGIAVAVVVVVVGVANFMWRENPLEPSDIEWLVPWLGWGVIAILALGLALQFFGRKKR